MLERCRTLLPRATARPAAPEDRTDLRLAFRPALVRRRVRLGS